MITDAGAIGQTLRERGSLSIWRYTVRKFKDGELERAPLAKISVEAAFSGSSNAARRCASGRWDDDAPPADGSRDPALRCAGACTGAGQSAAR